MSKEFESSKAALVTMDDPNFKELTKGNYEYAGMEKCQASYGYVGRTFDNVLPGISIKSQYANADYDFYRQNEAMPQNPRQIVDVCNRAYKKEGLVRNIIDLMGEFGCKGIQIVHPNKRAEKFGKQWFNYVNGKSVSERFLNLLYRLGHVPVSITHGKMPVTVEKRWSSTSADSKTILENVIQEPKVEVRRIPVKYGFLNPLSIEMIAPELAAFTDRPMYGLLITHSLRSAINKAKRIKNDKAIQELLSLIPPDIQASLNQNTQIIPLSDEDFSMYYYKKDDWETYATPMIYSIIPDIVTLEKMKLADKSALDGAISNIRLWTIGRLTDDPRTTLIPTPAMISKLRGILANNVGGGTMDLVWGPDLTFKESDTHVHQFLGISKYEPVYRSIYEGLGIPSSVAGGTDNGFNNTFVQMQTFIERLEYGRSVLLSFWTKELKKLQNAMGYKKPFKIMFDQINLGDDSSVKQVLIGLVDRDIISIDTLLTKFNIFSDIEGERIKREYKQRKKDNIPNKASPFHNPQSDEETKRVILRQGGVAPSQLGIDLQDKKPGEESFIEQQSKLKSQEKKYNPTSLGNGRPKNSKDTAPRKPRAVKIGKSIAESNNDFVSLFLWASSAQKRISDILTPEMVKSFGKNDVRALSKEEFYNLESTKASILNNIKPFSDINNDLVINLSKENLQVNPDIYMATKALVYKFTINNDRKPTTDEMRQIQSSAYALYFEDKNDDIDDKNVDGNLLADIIVD